MSRTVIVTVATTPAVFPAGPAAAGINITLSGATAIPAQTVAAAPYVATFTDVPDGDYVAVAHAVDVNGTAIGSPMTSAPFTVSTVPPSMTVDVPSSISVQVQ